MRFIVLALPIAAALALPSEATAQPFCANFSDGQRACGIPTFQSCLDTISGLGGSCGPDVTSQIPPNFMQRRRMRNNFDRPPSQQPGGFDWMPPPPGQ
jgi:hypothetical protein